MLYFKHMCVTHLNLSAKNEESSQTRFTTQPGTHPPRSKKLSCTSTDFRASTSAHIATKARSVSVLGSPSAAISMSPDVSTGGRAFLSSFPEDGSNGMLQNVNVHTCLMVTLIFVTVYWHTRFSPRLLINPALAMYTLYICYKYHIAHCNILVINLGLH